MSSITKRQQSTQVLNYVVCLASNKIKVKATWLVVDQIGFDAFERADNRKSLEVFRASKVNELFGCLGLNCYCHVA